MPGQYSYVSFAAAAAAVSLILACLVRHKISASSLNRQNLHFEEENRHYPQHAHDPRKENFPPPPPNILLLFPDQWRYDWDGRNATDANNNPRLLPLELPTIRKLTREGTHFLHAYVASPLCAPARACLASGLEYEDAGVPTNQHNDYDLHIPTFYTALRDKFGYETYTTGKDDLTKASKMGTKYHDGSGEGRNWTGMYHQHELGFSDGSIRCSGKIDVVSSLQPHERYGHWLQQQSIVLQNGTTISGWDGHVICMNRTNQCTPELFPDALYEDDWVTRQTISILKKAQGKRYKPDGINGDSSKPWFLQVNFPGPHPPFLVTSKQYQTVWNRTFPPPVDNPKMTKPETCTHHEFTRSPSRCNYAAEMENLDRNIAKILNSIDDKSNTIICFASDHGEMLLDHVWNGKTVPWQASVSVPLICKGPGIQAGAVVERPVTTMDLAATFLDYAAGGSDVDKSLQRMMTTTTTARSNLTMTSQSLRTLLETGEDDNYRTFISSGLQGTPFGETATTPTNAKEGGGQNWRMVVEAHSGLKLVCCKGKCVGSPSTIPPVNEHGYQQVLIDTLRDPFEMKPLNEEDPIAMERLRALLPDSFGCK